MKGTCHTVIRTVALFTSLQLACHAQLYAGEWIATTAPFTNWSAVACSADATKIAACVQGGGIYLSPDFGASWKKSTAPDAAWLGIAVSTNGSRILAAAYNGGIWSSVNAGESWEQTSAPSVEWMSVAISDDATCQIAASSGQVYLSKDSGKSWEAPQVLVGTQDRLWHSVTISADGSKMAASSTGPLGIVAVSSDTGQNWLDTTTETFAPFNDYWGYLSASSDGSRLSVGRLGIHTSFTAGYSWVATKSPQGTWGAIACSADGARLIALSGAWSGGAGPTDQIWVSADDGINWGQLVAPVRPWIDVAMSADAKRFVAIARGDGIYKWQPLAPVITLHPISQAVVEGTNVTLRAKGDFGAAPFGYQWRFNGSNLSGENNANLILTNVAKARAGEYSVVILNGFGSQISSNAIVSVQPFIITAQPGPLEQTVPGGVDISFHVSAVATAPLYYQWHRNGNQIVDATNSTLTLPHVGLSDSGSYSVLVSNMYGIGSGGTASLTVVPALISMLAQDSSTTDAILNVQVSAASTDTVVWFDWGPTTNKQYRSPLIDVPPSTNSIRVSHVLTNLSPYTRYFFQATVSNSFGVVVSDSIYYQFETVPRFVPTAAPDAYWTSIACSANGAQVLAAAGSLYISRDYGLTWNRVASTINTAGFVASSGNGRKLFAGVSLGNQTAGIYASADFGASWLQVGQPRAWSRLACSADGSTLLSCSDVVSVSYDSGATWQQASLPSGPWRGITISSDGTKMAASIWSGNWREAGMIWTSVDSGATWQPRGGQASVLVSSGDGSKLYVYAGGSTPPYTSFVSTDWGTSWEQMNLYFPGCTAVTHDGKKWFVQSGTLYNAMMCSNDGGSTWGYSDDNDLSSRAVACSADGGSVYIICAGGIRAWQDASPQLTIGTETNGTVVSWPSYRLSSRVQENSTLNPNDWKDLNEHPTLTNRIFRYTPPSARDKAFFRLRQP